MAVKLPSCSSFCLCVSFFLFSSFYACNIAPTSCLNAKLRNGKQGPMMSKLLNVLLLLLLCICSKYICQPTECQVKQWEAQSNVVPAKLIQLKSAMGRQWHTYIISDEALRFYYLSFANENVQKNLVIWDSVGNKNCQICLFLNSIFVNFVHWTT